MYCLSSVTLLLASLSRPLLEWRFCLVPGTCRCCCNTLTISPSWNRAQIFVASPFREGYKQEGIRVYRSMKYDKIGWDCLGTLQKNCTAVCHTFFSLCKCSDNN